MTANLDDQALASLMAEVTEPALQRQGARTGGIRILADGETLVLAAARRFWGIDVEDEAGQLVATDALAA
jgi:hypothetical protein